MRQTHLNLQEQALVTTTPTQSEKTQSAIRGHILFAFGIVLALALAWRLRDVLLLIYVSALFAVVLMPAVSSIMRFELRGGRHISRGAAIALLLSFTFLALAIFFMVARASSPGTAASLSGFAQSVGYLVASAGPLEVGLLHTVTGSWNIPVVLLLVLTAAELVVGLAAGRPLG